MTGCPIKRARKATAAADGGSSVVAFPRLNHPRAGLSNAKWRALAPAEKLERLFGMSLDDIHEIQSWPIGELDPIRLSVRMQVTRVVFMIGLKAHLDGTLARAAARERDGPRLLAELDRKLRERAEQTAAAHEVTTPAT
jgi:hypothetical protein